MRLISPGVRLEIDVCISGETPLGDVRDEAAAAAERVLERCGELGQLDPVAEEHAALADGCSGRWAVA